MIKLLRSVLCMFCFGVFGTGCLLVGSAIFPIVLVLYKSDKQRKIFVNTVHFSWRAFVWLMCVLRLIRVDCPARKQLRQLRGMIVVANHPSLIDVVILVSLIPNSVCVVKNSLFKNFFISRVIRKMYLSNTMSPDEFIKSGADALKHRYNIVVFPEGTRTITGTPVHLHRGFAYLQIATGADILPIRITNTPPILGKLQKWWDIDSKISVYTIKPRQNIIYNPNKNLSAREMAIHITKSVKQSLFQV